MGPLELGDLGENEDHTLEEGFTGPETNPSACWKYYSPRSRIRYFIFQPMLNFKF